MLPFLTPYSINKSDYLQCGKQTLQARILIVLLIQSFLLCLKVHCVHMAECFCLGFFFFASSPLKHITVEKPGVGDYRLFSLRHLPNILNLTKINQKIGTFVFRYFSAPCEKLCVTHYKCLSRTVICTERLQLFLRKYFLPPTLQEHLALLLSASCQMGHLAAGGESARGASSSCLTLTAPLARLTLATSQEMHPTAAGPMSRTLPVRVRYMDMFKN